MRLKAAAALLALGTCPSGLPERAADARVRQAPNIEIGKDRIVRIIDGRATPATQGPAAADAGPRQGLQGRRRSPR